MQLRDYQTQAIGRIKTEFKSGVKSTLLVMATGTGKTVTFTQLAKEYFDYWKTPVLVLAHRGELLDQAQSVLYNFGLKAEIEKADRYARGLPHDVVVASVQSLSQPKRLAMYPSDYFGFIIVDECFPAGTIIDGKPIERIKVGDRVRSYNHDTGQIELKPVVQLFKNPAKKLLKFILQNGKEVVCTEEHPIWNGKEYLPAIVFQKGTMMWYNDRYVISNPRKKVRRLSRRLPAEKLELNNDADLLGKVQGDSPGGTTDQNDIPLFTMLYRDFAKWPETTDRFKKCESILFDGLPIGISPENVVGNDGEDEPQIRIGKNETQQSDEESRIFEKDALVNDGQEIQRERRERQTNTATSRFSRSIELGHGTGRQHDISQTELCLYSKLLQSRFSDPRQENSHRDRREIAQTVEEEIAGRQENCGLKRSRVESVEVLERGSGQRFSEVCPDGFVYNIEVEDNHNYFANDILVHNCHHATADTYRRILKHFSGAKILGVTATPNRHDEIGLKNVFETCAFQYSIQDGIRDGYLCPVRGKQVVCEDLKLEQVKVVAGDFSASELEEMLMQESVLQEMVLPTIEHAGDRPTIVFTPSVNHAHAIAGCFNRVKNDSATVVDGRMNNETRSQNLKDFEEGKFQFIVNVGVLTEGYDHPPTACIALFRPTRSLGLLAQMIGRGTRICDGKTDCVVLDFVGVDRTVKTMNVLDVLDGSILSEQEKQKALEFQEEGDDAMEALDKAKKFVADLDSIKAKMRALTTSNAFDVLQMFAVPSVKGKYGGDLATLKQREYLIKKGLLVPPTMEKGEASKLIEKFVKRQEQGLATFKQLKYLKSLGYKDNFVETLSFAEAGELIGKMRGASGGR
jgi:superfamily II DNA or RNA helicase